MSLLGPASTGPNFLLTASRAYNYLTDARLDLAGSLRHGQPARRSSELPRNTSLPTRTNWIGMSACGRRSMSAFGGKADIATMTCHFR